VDDAVAQALGRLGLQREVVRVEHPVDRAVADRVRADVDAGVVEIEHDAAVRIRVDGRIAAVAGVDCREVLVPLVVHPRRARAAAAVHEHLHAPGQQHAVAERRRRLRLREDARHHLVGVLAVAGSAPQREHPHGQLAFAQQLLIEVPFLRVDAGILRAGHAFFVEVLDESGDAGFLLLAGIRRYEARHEPGRGFLEHARRTALRVAIDGAGRRVLGLRSHLGHLQRVAVGDAVVSRRLLQPYGVVRRDLCRDRQPSGSAAPRTCLRPSRCRTPTRRASRWHARGDALQHVVDRRDRRVGEINREELRRLREMNVRVESVPGVTARPRRSTTSVCGPSRARI
jgi:hypothetical protein